ncbi:hypothetical protein [Rhizorhabdus histidinilytica]|uniref:hypothetical protein n=1 Tax=Rhizorhabdus histidinilytica TaxID=439228 RepID=UPI00321F6320
MSDAIPSEEMRDERGRFIVPPVSPGRPKGSRNKLGEAFLEDMLADWQEHGKKAIATVRDERPQDYLKVVASILPKELNVKVSELDELSDEQLQRQLANVVAQLAATGIDLVAGIGAQKVTGSSGEVPTVQ